MGEHDKDAAYLELIYNLHSICEALAYDGLESACAMLKERIKHVAAMHGGIIPTIDGMILVTSLNRGLYDFFSSICISALQNAAMKTGCIWN